MAASTSEAVTMDSRPSSNPIEQSSAITTQINAAQTADERHRAWRNAFDQWKESGLSVSEFCRNNGLAIWAFRYWQEKLSGNGKPSSTRKRKRRAFLAVNLSDQPATHAAIVEVRLQNGRTIRFRESIAPETIEALVRILDASA